MSEAVAEATGNEESGNETQEPTEQPTESTVAVDDNGIPLVITDDFGKMAYAKAKSEGERYVALSNEIAAAEGNPSAMLDSMREIWGTDADSEATDADRKARAKIEELLDAVLKIETARDASLNERIKKTTANLAETLEPKKAEQAKAKDTYQGAVKLLTGMFGDDAAFGLPSVRGTRKAGSGTSTGTGAPRIRGYNFFVDGTLASQADQTGKQLSNAAAAGKAANVATSVVQEGFWAAIGSNDSKVYAGKSCEFTVTDSDGNEHEIKATPQPKDS